MTTTPTFTVRRLEHHSGIALRGITSVKAAITMFANGITRGSGDTGTQMIRDGGGLALVMKTMVESGHEGRFLHTLFIEMETALKSRDIFSRHYDYDGMGPFFKTTVEVAKLEDDLYILRLNAAYVGDKVEVGLAEALEVERALSSASVEVEIPAVDNQFVIDFNMIIERVGKVFDLNGLTGKKATEEIVTVGEFREVKQRVQIYETEKFVVMMGPSGVESPMKHDGNGSSKLVWTAKGAVLSGPLDQDWEDKTKFKTPVVAFHISNKKGDSYRKPPFTEADDKMAIRELAEKIAVAFQ